MKNEKKDCKYTNSGIFSCTHPDSRDSRCRLSDCPDDAGLSPPITPDRQRLTDGEKMIFAAVFAAGLHICQNVGANITDAFNGVVACRNKSGDTTGIAPDALEMLKEMLK